MEAPVNAIDSLVCGGRRGKGGAQKWPTMMHGAAHELFDLSALRHRDKSPIGHYKWVLLGNKKTGLHISSLRSAGDGAVAGGALLLGGPWPVPYRAPTPESDIASYVPFNINIKRRFVER